ncbi:LOW QUALITY PROTEIN: uncharacterized protein [Amphiura filiformis]|uniref:LOW QUALITY PROTEIN: uncharacterized protein n=1 Tax=Amphiura filiformis TaxID=82378 RepID=UPI003B20F848
MSAFLKRLQILKYFENSYSLNESIFTVIASEKAFYTCPDRLRLPLIFYYGIHLASLYMNKLLLAGLIKERINLEFETMFETGVDEMSWDDTENYRMGGSFKWPSLDKVVEFRAQVRQIVRRVIQETPLEIPVTQESQWWAVFMGMDHERIHIETSSVLIRQLPIHMVHRPMGWTIAPKLHGDGVNKNVLVQVNETDVSVGKPRDFPTYGWDNEYPEINKKVPAFEASAHLITNKQFLHFVNTDGYKNKQWWSKEGWQWCEYRNTRHPAFWVCEEGCISNVGGTLSGHSHCKPVNNNQQDTENQSNGNLSNGVIGQENGNTEQLQEKYRLRIICDEIDMPWDWPVVVNYHEANAYCNWLGQGYRLMTEAEHHAIRDPEPSSSEGASAEFSLSPEKNKKYNINMQYGTSTPVNMHPPTEGGFYDVFGNVWEWTEDHFNGLPGYQTHAYYDDFSTPTFDGRHNVIMGGSWVSTGSQAARFGRYAFRRHFYQHAGFRIARTLDDSQDPPVALMPIINTEEQEITIKLADVDAHMTPSTNTQLQQEKAVYLCRQLLMEFNTQGDNYFQALSSACLETMQRHGTEFNKALDIGCGCGSMTFELSNHFQKIIGTDICGQFIDAAEKLRQNGCLSYHQTCDDSPIAKQPKLNCNSHTNGDTHMVQAKVMCKFDQTKIGFKQFTWLPNELAAFDLVIQRSLHRVQNKKAWLLRLGDIIVPTGLVIIVCTDDWTERDIMPTVNGRLKLVETTKMQYKEDGEEKSALLTAWKKA